MVLPRDYIASVTNAVVDVDDYAPCSVILNNQIMRVVEAH